MSCLPTPVVVLPTVTNKSRVYKQTIDLCKQPISTRTHASPLLRKPILKSPTFEQPPVAFRLPEDLHLPALNIPPGHTHKAMFPECKIKKIFHTHLTCAYADSGTDIHIINPQTARQLGLPHHPYVKPVTIQFGDGSLRSATHFVFMGDILGEAAIVDTAPSTLISIYSITTKGLSVTFNNKRIKITDDFTGRLLYRNRIITPGHYTIDIEKFMKIQMPTDFKYYKQASQRAAATYETMLDGHDSTTYDTDDSQGTAEASPHPYHHTCAPQDENIQHHAFVSASNLIAINTFSNITPTRKRYREPRRTAAQTRKILWLHKCMGHPGRDALADFVDSA